MGLREVYFVLVYLSFFVIGIGSPFVLALGYVWIDILYPQSLSDALASMPVAAIIGGCAIFAYVVGDRRSARVSLQTVLAVLMAVWVTLTLLWAEAPVFALMKWDWAFKTVLFSAFLPLFFRSRVQIEAFLQVFVLGVAAYMIPIAIKTLVAGGGYGQRIGLTNINSGISESSTLATFCVAIIPIALFLRKHSILIPNGRLRNLGYLGLAFASVFGAIGTFARTAVVGFAVVAVEMFLRSRRKLIFAVVGIGFAGAVLMTVSSSWDSRISTIEDYSKENSALTRLLVWDWTLRYSIGHPFGGGFNAYVISRIEYPQEPGQIEPTVVVGRAFHSSFFEMLGEQGYPGLALFLAICGVSLNSVRIMRRDAKKVPHLLWASELAAALRTSLLTMLAGGAFVGIGFQPEFWYMFAIIAALRQHVRHVVRAEAALHYRAPFGSGAASAVRGRPDRAPVPVMNRRVV